MSSITSNCAGPMYLLSTDENSAPTTIVLENLCVDFSPNSMLQGSYPVEGFLKFQRLTGNAHIRLKVTSESVTSHILFDFHVNNRVEGRVRFDGLMFDFLFSVGPSCSKVLNYSTYKLNGVLRISEPFLQKVSLHSSLIPAF